MWYRQVREPYVDDRSRVPIVARIRPLLVQDFPAQDANQGSKSDSGYLDFPIEGQRIMENTPLQMSHRVNHERVRVLFRQLNVALINSLVIATIVAGILGIDRPVIALWFGTHIVITLLRLALARRFSRGQPGGEDLGPWLRGYTLGALASGITWAMVLPLGLDTSPLSSATVITCMVLAGIVAGALPTMSASVGAYVVFSLPILSAVVVWSLFKASPALPSLALVSALYMVVMLIAVRQFNQLLVQGLGLGLDKLDLLERVKADHTALQKVQSVTLREHQLAAHVMDSLIQTKVCADCGIRRHHQPLHDFEGDIFLFDIARDGSARLLLGDATGHGLSAALAAIPVAQTFNAVNRKGLSADILIAELNHNLHRMLPGSMFVAAALLEMRLNGTGGCDVQVWNGGLDDLLVRRTNGTIERVPSRNLALGILDETAFSAQFQTLDLDVGDCLYAYSDGVTEAVDASGRLFTRERLETVLSTAEHGRRLPAVVEAVTEFRGSVPLQDDLTILEIDSGDLADSLGRRLNGCRTDVRLAAG